ncbi:MAG: aspartate carbamoyltransferase [Candidatus Micrarchaeota archaeon]|nr:aspartate carbamoyltransferase [Candidatus Micrarchaeota archaeon]
MGERLKHFVESQQLDEKLIYNLFRGADSFRQNPRSNLNLDGKTVAMLFYEPSTRTRFSFESAAMGLGAKIIGTEDAKKFSSTAKGESLEDTIMVVGGYCDGIVLRHDQNGAAARAAEISDVPIINAGDGKGQHPTQALLDAYTIYRELGSLNNIKLAFVGDLASGRTVRSLCYLMGKFSGIDITFVSPENLRIGQDIQDYLRRNGAQFREDANLERVLPQVDIVYMTRIQRERISAEEYDRAHGKYAIDENNFRLIRRDGRLMHPLPHLEEIDLPVELVKNDKRVAYIRQAHNGLFIRMALLAHMLG